jgi:hypothetical protein
VPTRKVRRYRGDRTQTCNPRFWRRRAFSANCRGKAPETHPARSRMRSREARANAPSSRAVTLVLVNDPRLESLQYELVTLEGSYDFASTEPWEGRLADFACRLADRTLVATAEADFPDAASGRAVLEPALRAWETHLEMAHRMWVEFRYESAKVIDQQPTPGGHDVALAATVSGGGTVSATVVAHPGSYPEPPVVELGDTVLVRELRERVRDVRHRRERLLSAAYWFHTRLAEEYGGPKAAASHLNVSRNVLDHMKKLAAVDDPQESRMAKGPKRPLTPNERAWIMRAMPALVLRVAEVEASWSPPAKQLTMAELGGRPV